MAFINSIDIIKFRGIQKLTVSEFSNINLIVGDNNSGKTTFLEAIQLLFAKSQLSSIKSVINQRTVLNSNSSFYTVFFCVVTVSITEGHPLQKLFFHILSVRTQAVHCYCEHKYQIPKGPYSVPY